VKIKCRPEDFIVEEVTDVLPSDGAFALYRLEKRSVTTLDAIDGVKKHWRVERDRVAWGGLKDRHAWTHQHITIRNGPAENFETPHFSVRHLGFIPNAFRSHDIRANRFVIVMRDLLPDDAEKIVRASADLERSGVANYFDEQRFGSVGFSREFVAKAWCLGDYETAIRLALADPNEHDRPREKKEKATLRELWGKWPEAKAALAKSHRRSIVTFLADRPGDFKGAFGCINPELLGLFRNALQSEIWNRAVSAMISESVPRQETFGVRQKTGLLVFFRRLPDDVKVRFEGLELPMPSARAEFADDAVREKLESAAGTLGLKLDDMRIRHPKSEYFSKGTRSVLLFPNNVSAQAFPDNVYPRKSAVKIAFELPRGSYATMVIKRLTEDPDFKRKKKDQVDQPRRIVDSES
jgi:tRNA pseudouridine13 synthase